VKWYKKAAEKGNVDAQFRLGYCYEQGRGVKGSYGEAIKWYKKAGQQGDSVARERMRLLLNSGNFKELENNFKEEDEEEMKGRWGF
jgi:TPR repeat protein